MELTSGIFNTSIKAPYVFIYNKNVRMKEYFSPSQEANQKEKSNKYATINQKYTQEEKSITRSSLLQVSE